MLPKSLHFARFLKGVGGIVIVEEAKACAERLRAELAVGSGKGMMSGRGPLTIPFLAYR
jgi:hypothetical protein